MELHPLYGISLPENGWVPAPRYLLRRSRILSALNGVQSGVWLEIGCGAGALLLDLARRGFSCSTLETSGEALMLAESIGKKYGFPLHVYTRPEQIPGGSFDCIGAFEVLEHLKDDKAALREWSKWLRGNGRLYLSVPAHMHKWSATDTWAGHYRRYDRQQLIAVMNAAGFEVERCECYGFPLGNMLDPFRAGMHAAEMKRTNRDGNNHNRGDATAQSGTNRKTEARLYPVLKSLPGRLIMRLAFRMQKLFLKMDLGNGYFAVGRKK